MKRKLTVACAAASLVVGLGWQVSAFAYPALAAAIATNSAFSAPGGSLTVNGQNFAGNEKILLTLFSHGVPLVVTASNAGGSFSAPVTLPSNTTPGQHTIEATGASGDSAGTVINVVVPYAVLPSTGPAPFPSVAALGSGPAAGTPKALRLSRITLVPGQATVMTGHGCAPGADVVVFIGKTEVEQITANSQGTFSTSLAPPDPGVGQVTITAVCGSKRFVGVATLVSTAKVSGPEGSVAVGGAFVLLGAVLVRGQFGSTSTRRRRRRRRGASDFVDT